MSRSIVELVKASPAAGLYVHVPFCSAVCPYCDFAVMVGGGRSRSRYRDALLREVELWAARGLPFATPFDTFYFGGGTPSALSPEALEACFAALRRAFGDPAWIHFEANPEDVTAERAALWRHLGVGTVSLGVQSFQAPALEFLGRRHDPAAARRAVELTREAGLPALSVDLIYGLPGQGEAEWRRDLEAAVALAPEHVSCYQLTVEPGTPFGRRRELGELTEMPEPGQAALFRLTHRFLADAGYAAYEVSNFARAPEHRSRHNRKYWDHSPYLGLGPSAHSFDGGRRRWWNHRRLSFWAAVLDRAPGDGTAPPVAGEEVLSRHDLALERLMLALRTTAGIDLARFRQRYGVDLVASDGRLMEELAGAGLARMEGGRFALTLDGLAVADGLAARFDLGAEEASQVVAEPAPG